MLPAICPECSPHLAKLREYAASGAKHIMDFAKYMETVTDTLPDDLKPTGQVLTEISMRALIESYVESLKLISELGLQEITRAARTPTHPTEPDTLKRSGSDEI
jgi:hypothetical protein